MTLSMTGFGAAHLDHPLMAVDVEIKAVNHRHFSARIQMPARYSAFEIELHRFLSERIVRGQAHAAIQVTFKDPERLRRRFNVPLLRAYLDELRPLSEPDDDVWEGVLSALLRFPETTLSPHPDDKTLRQEWEIIAEVVARAVVELEAFRRTEGRRLAQHIRQALGGIKEALAYVEQTQDERRQRLRDAALERIQTLQADEHFQREALEREIVAMLERLDISEEIARLKSHIHLFETTLDVPAKGKKLGFIAQEMGREINTIAAKARDFGIQEQTILMKDHLEQIKEQLANVL